MVTELAVRITGEDLAAVTAEELDGGGGVGFEGEVLLSVERRSDHDSREMGSTCFRFMRKTKKRETTSEERRERRGRELKMLWISLSLPPCTLR